MYRRARTLLTVLVFSLGALPAPVALGGEKAPDLPEVSPAWTARFAGDVLWHRVTPLGYLVVSTRSGLHGVDPESGSILWRHEDLKNLSAEGYQDLLNTPLVLLGDEDVDDRILILHTVDGRILFDSEKSGIHQVLSTHLLPRSGCLVIFGLRTGHATSLMSLLDLSTGDLLWTNEDIFAGENKLAKFAAAIFQAITDTSGIVSQPHEVDEESFLIAAATGIYLVSTKSGDFLWKTRNTHDAASVRFYLPPKRRDIVYVGTEVVSSGEHTSGMVTSYYSAYRIADGTAAWDKPVKLKGSLNDAIFVDGGMIIASGPDGSGKLKLLDYASGKSLWGKKGSGVKVGGSLVDHQFVDGAILLTTGKDSVWTRAGTVYSMNFLDPSSGSLRFPKPVKVKGRLLTTEVLPKGVLYVTTSELNVFESATGQALNKSVVSDGSLVTAAAGSRLYAFSQDDGALYVLDKQTGAIRRLSKAPVKLLDKDIVDALELGQDRITVLSSQNLFAFDLDGGLLFHAHHAAPRQPTWMRALLTAQAVRAAMASASSGVYSGAFARAAESAEPGSAGQTIAGEFARGYADLSEGYAGLSKDYFRVANARFKASAATEDYQLMMVRLPQKGVGLVSVSKGSGEIVSAINLGKDREPAYQVDAVDNRVYYISDSNELQGYIFEPLAE